MFVKRITIKRYIICPCDCGVPSVELLLAVIEPEYEVKAFVGHRQAH